MPVFGSNVATAASAHEVYCESGKEKQADIGTEAKYSINYLASVDREPLLLRQWTWRVGFFFSLIAVVYFRCGKPKYNPGGSALNTCRILRALGEKNVIFCGAIGADENGEILTQILKDTSLSTW